MFLFPTKRDPWGVVANEALAAGVPVVVTPEAGAAGDLVVDGFNGYVIPPLVDDWASRSTQLLDDRDRYAAFSANAVQSVKAFNCERAAKGILDAIAFCQR